MTRALVLGGGVAGIAVAFGLRDRGFEVELFESRGWLGGRAFSLPPTELAGPIDNGPHVMLGCYDHMRALLRRIGTEGEFDQPVSLSLVYVDATGLRSDLRLSRLPAPIALPAALLRVRGVRFADRLRALRAMSGAVFGARPDATLADWLRARRQDGAPRSYFWDPLCRAIMNAEAEHVAASVFLGTLKRAFFGSARRAAIWAPKRPWSEIIGRPAHAQLERDGVRVHTHWRATGVEVEAGRVARIRFDRHEPREIEPDTVVVSALPWHVLPRLGLPVEGKLDELQASPIVSVYFDAAGTRGLPTEPVVALVDGDPFHFLCRWPDADAKTFGLLSGGRRDFDGVSTAQIEGIARAQLARHFPGAELGHGRARVVKEHRATFVAAPGSDRKRLPHDRFGELRNLWVCGDWTAISLPSTLEAAAESGTRLAAQIAAVDPAR